TVGLLIMKPVRQLPSKTSCAPRKVRQSGATFARRVIADADSKLSQGLPAASGCESTGLPKSSASFHVHRPIDRRLRPLRQLIFPRHESVEPAFFRPRFEKL